MAETHNGYMFYTEHRYYGDSIPTELINMYKHMSRDATHEYGRSNSNITLMTIGSTNGKKEDCILIYQALEDLAFFIKAKKAKIDGLEDSKVVVIGASYSANLATWARIKYPHLIDVAYASSAPLRAKVDFFEYFEVVNREFKRTSEQRVRIIQEAFTGIERLLHTQTGINYLSSLFNTCSPPTNEDPYKSFFFYSIAKLLGVQVQYAVAGHLELVCEFFQESNRDPIETLAVWNAQFYDDVCMDGYGDYVEWASSDIPSENIERLWMYQVCTEFGIFHTSNSDDQPFGKTFPLALYTQICTDLFGEGFTNSVTNSAVERTNIVYGSDEPVITNLVSVHGTVDPWHILGISENCTSDTVVTIYVEGTSHCADLESVREDDLEQLKAAKLRVLEVISEWISD